MVEGGRGDNALDPSSLVLALLHPVRLLIRSALQHSGHVAATVLKTGQLGFYWPKQENTKPDVVSARNKWTNAVGVLSRLGGASLNCHSVISGFSFKFFSKTVPLPPFQNVEGNVSLIQVKSVTRVLLMAQQRFLLNFETETPCHVVFTRLPTQRRTSPCAKLRGPCPGKLSSVKYKM